ncbi:MAG: oxamate carbamoyltransferase subunit AllG family protein [Solirubrobacteraceae bacterium]
MPWVRYTGGQRAAVIRSALFEGLATDELQANELLGELKVAGCHDYGCVGSLASVTTPSIPVLVVEDAGTTDRAYCTLFEGSSPARLNYGVYNEQVKQTLLFLERVVV